MKTHEEFKEKTSTSKPLIAVLGAGMAGSLVTNELLKSGYRVKLIDMNETILGKTSSTDNACDRIHNGEHYFAHLPTALECLNNSFEYVLTFEDCVLGDDKLLKLLNVQHFSDIRKEDLKPLGKDTLAEMAENKLKLPWRRGRYYIMSNSQVDVDSVKLVVEKLKETYAKKCKETGKQPFGPPENFIVELNENDYPEIAKEIEFEEAGGKSSNQRVLYALETAEPQIDVSKFRKRLEKQQKRSLDDKSLDFVHSTKVIDIEYHSTHLGYIVNTENLSTGEKAFYEVDGVFNCTWQNIEKIRKKLELPKLSVEETYIRPKVFIKIKLPKELLMIHSCTFSVGAYCGITNNGDGTAKLTYEIATNLEHYKADEEPPVSLKEIYEDRLSTDSPEGLKIMKRILEGCARYITPYENLRAAFANSKVLSVHLGHVRQTVLPGQNINLHSPTSAHHMRVETAGVHPATFAYVDFASMKMNNAHKTAPQAVSILDLHFQVKNKYFPQEEADLVELVNRRMVWKQLAKHLNGTPAAILNTVILPLIWVFRLSPQQSPPTPTHTVAPLISQYDTGARVILKEIHHNHDEERTPSPADEEPKATQSLLKQNPSAINRLYTYVTNSFTFSRRSWNVSIRSQTPTLSRRSSDGANRK